MSRVFEAMTGLVLLDPWFLAVLALVPVALWWAARRRPPAVVFGPASLLDSKGDDPAVGLPSTGAGAPARPTGPSRRAELRDVRTTEPPLPRTWRVRFQHAPRVLQVLAVVFAATALARPARLDRIPLATAGIDVLLCLDVSSSMSAPMPGEDADPARSRLDVAKETAARFVAARRHDRVGLITFARYPDLRCPPTLDHVALGAVLAAAAPVASDGPEAATGIGTATARAAQALRSSEARSKVVILLTDGEENVSTALTPDEIAPIHAGQLCRELGVRVYTISAGEAGAGRGASDPRQARRLADATGGRAFAAGDAAAMTRAYEEIDALERVDLAEPRYRIEERFGVFVAIASAFAVAATLLRLTILDVLP